MTSLLKSGSNESIGAFTENMVFYPAQPGQVPIYEENRRRVIALATYVFETLPQVPERTLVRRGLEEVLRQMNQVVAVNGVGTRPAQ